MQSVYRKYIPVGTGLLAGLFLLLTAGAQAQVSGAFKDETALYAETKQVNQFFRRFNNEESIYGKRYYEGDSLYRSVKGRSSYLKILFDNQNTGLRQGLKDSFIAAVTDRKRPVFLDFHGGEWMAQVSAAFLWNKKEVDVVLFLKLQEEKIGSKWVISSVSFPPFRNLFDKDTTANTYFLHPMSHELDFLNLFRVFRDNKAHAEDYTARGYEPDQLTPFLYELKRGNLEFKTIHSVKFHFFQVQGWYFELSRFNRSGNNTGWLISNLMRAGKNDRKIIEDYIHKQ
jgi:hypothetical protein